MSDDDIMALVGPATWANGLRLERAGAVRDVSWATEDGQLEARVKDAGLTYRVRISHGALRPTLACACPLRSDCPHAVAALITGRAQAIERQSRVPEWSRVLGQVLGGERSRGGDPRHRRARSGRGGLAHAAAARSLFVDAEAGLVA